MKEEDIKKLNIYEKMSLITEEIGVIEKGLKVQVNKTSSYKAVSERDVLDAVKPIERKYRVFSFPKTRQILEKDILVTENEYGKKSTLFMRIDTVYCFVNLDKPAEYIETNVYGDGLDTGDKAPGKAMTYADKYALMKTYKLSTGDDLDKNPSTDKIKKNKMEEELILIYLDKLNGLVAETNTNYEEILKYFEVKTNKDMTLQQLKKAVAILERKKNKNKEEVF